MEKIKVIIAGGRNFNNYELMNVKLNKIFKLKKLSDIEIVCGKARGADSLGEQYAKKNGIGIRYFAADWDTYGKSAGYIRNKQMAEYSNCLVAFWDGNSKGTKHMIDLAKEYNLDTRIIRY